MKKIILLLSIILASCSVQKKQHIGPYIYFSETRCLGKCPVYDISIYSNGKVLYNGIENVSKMGIHRTTISLKKMKTLEKTLKNIDLNLLKQKFISKRDLSYCVLKYNGTILKTREKHKLNTFLESINSIISKFK